MKVRAVLTEAVGRWTATAPGIDCPPGEGETPEDAIADLREHIAAGYAPSVPAAS